MKQAELRVANRLGLHARAAARFVHLASQFKARVVVSRGPARADGKSILGLLTLAAARGSRIKLVAEGDDEEQAVASLTELIHDGFGEEE